LKHSNNVIDFGLSLSDPSISVLCDLFNGCNAGIDLISVCLKLLVEVKLLLSDHLVKFFADFQTGRLCLLLELLNHSLPFLTVIVVILFIDSLDHDEILGEIYGIFTFFVTHEYFALNDHVQVSHV
jgi:hypothetical protein